MLTMYRLCVVFSVLLLSNLTRAAIDPVLLEQSVLNGWQATQYLGAGDSTGYVEGVMTGGPLTPGDATGYASGHLTVTGIHDYYAAHQMEFVGDFNGDKRADFLYRDETTGIWRKLISTDQLWIDQALTGVENGLARSSGASGGAFGHRQPAHFTGDFDGDGKADFLYFTSSNIGAGLDYGWVMMPSSNNWVQSSWADSNHRTLDDFWGGSSSSSYGVRQRMYFTGDFSGDGKTDFMYYKEDTSGGSGGAWQVIHGTATGSAEIENLTLSSSALMWNAYAPEYNRVQPLQFVGDFNGDGNDDFMFWGGITTKWQVLLRSADGTHWASRSSWGGDVWKDIGSGNLDHQSQPFHFTGDFNGDGKTDFMYWDTTAETTGWRVLFSTGSSGWQDVYIGPALGAGGYVGDFTGNGRDDLLQWDTNPPVGEAPGWRVLSVPYNPENHLYPHFVLTREVDSYALSWRDAYSSNDYHLFEGLVILDEQGRETGIDWQHVQQGGYSYTVENKSGGFYRYKLMKYSFVQATGALIATHKTSSAFAVHQLAAPSISGPATSDSGNYTLSVGIDNVVASTDDLDFFVGNNLVSTPETRFNVVTGEREWDFSDKGSGLYQYHAIARYDECKGETIEEAITLVIFGGQDECSEENLTANKTVSVVRPSAPLVTVNNGGDIAWQDVANLEYYRLEELQTDGAWQLVYSGENSFFANAVDGNHYRIQGCELDNDSNVSDTCSQYTEWVYTAEHAFSVPEPAASPDHLGFGDDAIGALEANFRVNETGAATYSIPIMTAAGTAGVVPEVGLFYSSQVKHGVAGKGWNIQAGSAITRCNQNELIEGQVKPFNFEDDDRFCLDGLRLLVINGDAYGSVGASYKTHFDNFSTITSQGGSQGNPDRFIVEGKDGSVSVYGGTVNSKQLTPDSTYTLTWGISTFEDSVGNPIKYQYHNSAEGFALEKIFYAFGDNQSQTESNTYIYFEYSSGRSDSRSGYKGSYLFRNSLLLENIRSYNEHDGYPTLMRKYVLGYQGYQTVSDRKNELVSITECSDEGEASCKPETRFRWKESSPYNWFSGGDVTSNSIPFHYIHDGLVPGYGVMAFECGGGGSIQKTGGYIDNVRFVGERRLGWRMCGNYTWTCTANVSASDIQNNSSTTITVNDFSQQKFVCYNYRANFRYDGTLFTDTSYQSSVFSRFYGWRGISATGSSSSYFYQNSSGGWERGVAYNPRPYVPGLVSEQFLIGEGGSLPTSQSPIDSSITRSDYFGFGEELSPMIIDDQLLLEEWGVNGIISSNAGATRRLNVVDINLDGARDVIYIVGNSLYYRLAYAGGFEAQKLITTGVSEVLGILDYDIDNNLDILVRKQGSLQYASWNCNTQSFTSPIFIASINSSHSYIVSDITFNGEPDILELWVSGSGAGSSINTNVYNPEEPQIRNIDQIQEGALSITTINYHRIGAEKSGNADPNLEVVKSVARNTQYYSEVDDNIVDGEHILQYQYSQPRSIQDLGFRFDRMTIVDMQNGTKRTTVFSTDNDDRAVWHRPRAVWNFAADGSLSSKTRYFWRLKIPGESIDEENLADRTHFAQYGPIQPYLAKTESITYKTQSDKSSFTVTSDILRTVVDEYDYDFDGNLIEHNIETFTGGGTTANLIKRQTTVNEYTPAGWDLVEATKMGRLSRSTVTHHRPALETGADITKVSSFSYVENGLFKGLLETETIAPDTPDILTTYYDYDAVGNRSSITRVGADLANERVTSYEYDDNERYRYIKKVVNSKSQVVSEVLARNHYGNTTKIKNIDGVVSETRFTPLGRQYLAYSPTGDYVHTFYIDCIDGSLAASCPANAVYGVKAGTGSGGYTIEYYDALKRLIQTEQEGFSGSIYTDTQYDIQGRVARQSTPYYLLSNRYWSTNQYDQLNQVIEKTSPHTSLPIKTEFEYDGFKTTFIIHSSNPNAMIDGASTQTKIQQSNALGETESVTDEQGNVLSYVYYDDGNVRNVTTTLDAIVPRADGLLSDSITTEMTYDIRGRKLSLLDPDKGLWEYQYNGFGEIVWQLNANNHTTVSDYDALGRLVFREDTRSNGTIESTTHWDYDRADTGIGRLAEVRDDVSGYHQTYAYDQFGRAITTTTTTGNAANDATYSNRVIYDEFGRVFQRFDTSLHNTIEYSYTPAGYVEEVIKADQQQTLYTVNAMTARNQLKQMTWGNGYVTHREYDAARGLPLSVETIDVLGINKVQDLTVDFDDFGNLISRYNQGLGDAVNDVTGNTVAKDINEVYWYDTLNRLVETHTNGALTQSQSYDGFGNIMNKDGIGIYSYGFGVASAIRPHAVVSTADGVSYQYDDNGNLVSDTSLSGGRQFTYTVFDKPSSIMKGANTHIAFTYGPNRSRVKRVDNESGQIKSTLYMGDIERITHSDGSIEYKQYVDGNVLISGDGVSASTVQYLMTGHLGSVELVMNHDLSAANDIIASDMSFNAWGQRRKASDASSLTVMALLGFDTALTTRGYTGHEMLDAVGIIHMNGRIYDPHLARFVQADTYVQNAADFQVYNRYSYVRNNPLNATDPSGYMFLGTDNSADNLGAGSAGCSAFICPYADGGYSRRDGWRISGGVSGVANLTPDFNFSLPSFSRRTSGIDWDAFAASFESAEHLDIVNGAVNHDATINRIASMYADGGTSTQVTGSKYANGAETFAYFNALGASYEPSYLEQNPFALASNEPGINQLAANLVTDAQQKGFREGFQQYAEDQATFIRHLDDLSGANGSEVQTKAIFANDILNAGIGLLANSSDARGLARRQLGGMIAENPSYFAGRLSANVAAAGVLSIPFATGGVTGLGAAFVFGTSLQTTATLGRGVSLIESGITEPIDVITGGFFGRQ